MSKIFLSCLFPLLLTIERKLTGIFVQKFNHRGD
jgi:hypothetical protein